MANCTRCPAPRPQRTRWAIGQRVGPVRLLLERCLTGSAPPPWFVIGKGGVSSTDARALQPPQSVEEEAGGAEQDGSRVALHAGRVLQVSLDSSVLMYLHAACGVRRSREAPADIRAHGGSGMALHAGRVLQVRRLA